MTPHRIVVTDAEGRVATEVMIGRGPEPVLPEREDRQKVAVLHQPGHAASTAAQVAADLGRDGYFVHRFELPDRDAAKLWKVVAGVHDWMADLEFGRSDAVVGVGGGAATDVAGFVAATWMRGIEVAYVPTTLLGAVDASIGGKTGVNLKGKNLVGAFWHPSRVTIDLDTLDQLPELIKREGWAETVKAGFIADTSLIEDFRRHGTRVPLETALPKAVAVKAGIVSEDFREHGRRAILNFGHTIGHAVEMIEECSHGEAVGIGMAGAAEASRSVTGFESDIPELVASLGLPVKSQAAHDRIRFLLRLDKKRDQDGLRMVLLRSYGDPIVHHVDGATVDAALAFIAGP